MAERKSAFAEFQHEIRLQEKRDARELKQQRRDNYVEMLRELQQNRKNPINLDYLSKFYVVSKRI
jgi:hypothetical protein